MKLDSRRRSDWGTIRRPTILNENVMKEDAILDSSFQGAAKKKKIEPDFFFRPAPHSVSLLSLGST